MEVRRVSCFKQDLFITPEDTRHDQHPLHTRPVQDQNLVADDLQGVSYQPKPEHEEIH
jgi:hypothetical protein